MINTLKKILIKQRFLLIVIALILAFFLKGFGQQILSAKDINS